MFSFPPSMLRERQQLHSIAIPDRTGEVSDRWKGIHHGELAELLVHGAGKHGLSVLRDRWAVNEDGAQMYGYLNLEPAQSLGIELPDGLTLTMAVRNDNLSRFSLKVLAGSTIKVCSNGLYIGDYCPIKKRHTVGLKLNEVVDAGFERFISMTRHGIAEQVAALRQVDLSQQRRVDDILVKSARGRIVSWSAAGKIDRLWQEPPHEEFRERNGWSMLNAFTEYCKVLAPMGQARVMQGARNLILADSN